MEGCCSAMDERNVPAEPQIIRDRCTNCGACVAACHADALALSGSTPTVVEISRCDYCGECEAVCPTNAIRCPYEISYRQQQQSHR